MSICPTCGASRQKDWPLPYTQWKRGLEEEDREEGLGKVNRPPEALSLLYRMYRDSFRKRETGGHP